MFTFHINYPFNLDELLKKVDANQETLSLILKNQTKIMATIQELSAKADELQASLDAEQAQIQAALAKQTQAIEDLKKLIIDGGTEAERQAVLDKLEAAKADLEGTIVEEPTPPVEPA